MLATLIGQKQRQFVGFKASWNADQLLSKRTTKNQLRVNEGKLFNAARKNCIQKSNVVSLRFIVFFEISLNLIPIFLRI